MDGCCERFDSEVRKIRWTAEGTSLDGAGCVADDGGRLGSTTVEADEERHCRERGADDGCIQEKAVEQRTTYLAGCIWSTLSEASHVCYLPRSDHMVVEALYWPRM